MVAFDEKELQDTTTDATQDEKASGDQEQEASTPTEPGSPEEGTPSEGAPSEA
jgi:hypothetical protein